jgi:hypothetical protein
VPSGPTPSLPGRGPRRAPARAPGRLQAAGPRLRLVLAHREGAALASLPDDGRQRTRLERDQWERALAATKACWRRAFEGAEPARPERAAGAMAAVLAVASEAGTELNRSNLAGRVLKPAARTAGLAVEVEGRDEPVPWVSFHTLRHTCASLLFEGGKNVKQVQEWLGHADPGFTLRTYVHLMDEGLGDAEFMDAAVRLPQPAEPEPMAA